MDAGRILLPLLTDCMLSLDLKSLIYLGLHADNSTCPTIASASLGRLLSLCKEEIMRLDFSSNSSITLVLLSHMNDITKKNTIRDGHGESEGSIEQFTKLVEILAEKYSEIERQLSYQRRLHVAEQPVVLSTSIDEPVNCSLACVLDAAADNVSLHAYIREQPAFQVLTLEESTDRAPSERFEVILGIILSFVEKDAESALAIKSVAIFLRKLINVLEPTRSHTLRMLMDSVHMKRSAQGVSKKLKIAALKDKIYDLEQALEVFLWSVSLLGHVDARNSSEFVERAIRQLAVSLNILTCVSKRVARLVAAPLFASQKRNSLIDAAFLQYMNVDMNIFEESHISSGHPVYIVCKRIITLSISSAASEYYQDREPSRFLDNESTSNLKLLSIVYPLRCIDTADATRAVLSDIAQSTVAALLSSKEGPCFDSQSTASNPDTSLDGALFRREIFIALISQPDESSDDQVVEALSSGRYRRSWALPAAHDFARVQDLLLSFVSSGVDVSTLLTRVAAGKSYALLTPLLLVFSSINSLRVHLRTWLSALYTASPVSSFLDLADMLLIASELHTFNLHSFPEVIREAISQFMKILSGVVKRLNSDASTPISNRILRVIRAIIVKFEVSASVDVLKSFDFKPENDSSFSIFDEEAAFYHRYNIRSISGTYGDEMTPLMFLLSEAWQNSSPRSLLIRSQIVCRMAANSSTQALLLRSILTMNSLRNTSLSTLFVSSKDKLAESLISSPTLTYCSLEKELYPLDIAPLVADVSHSELLVELMLQRVGGAMQFGSLCIDLIGSTAALVHVIRSLVVFGSLRRNDEFSIKLNLRGISRYFSLNNSLRGVVKVHSATLVLPVLIHVFQWHTIAIALDETLEATSSAASFNHFSYLLATLELLCCVETNEYIESIVQIFDESMVAIVSRLILGSTVKLSSNHVAAILLRTMLGVLARETLRKIDLCDRDTGFLGMLPLYSLCCVSLLCDQSGGSLDVTLIASTYKFCIALERQFMPLFGTGGCSTDLGSLRAGNIIDIGKTNYYARSSLSCILIENNKSRSYFHLLTPDSCEFKTLEYYVDTSTQNGLSSSKIKIRVLEARELLEENVRKLLRYSPFSFQLIALPSYSHLWKAQGDNIYLNIPETDFYSSLLLDLHILYCDIEFNNKYDDLCVNLLENEWQKSAPNDNILASSISLVIGLSSDRDQISSKVSLYIMKKLKTLLITNHILAVIRFVDQCPLELLSPPLQSSQNMDSLISVTFEVIKLYFQSCMSSTTCNSELKLFLVLTNIFSIMIGRDLNLLTQNQCHILAYPFDLLQVFTTKLMKTSTLEEFKVSDESLETITLMLTLVAFVRKETADSVITGINNFSDKYKWSLFVKSVVDVIFECKLNDVTYDINLKKRLTSQTDIEAFILSSQKNTQFRTQSKLHGLSKKRTRNINIDAFEYNDQHFTDGICITDPPVILNTEKDDKRSPTKEAPSEIPLSVDSVEACNSASPASVDLNNKTEAWKPASNDLLAKKFGISF